MKRGAFLLSSGAVMAAAFSAVPAMAQNTAWDPVSNRSYRLETTDNNWINAHNAAQAAGWNLVSIGSAAENTTAAHLSPGDAWIGLTDNEQFNTTEGTYVWTDGTAVSYTNWGTGEPNNHAPGEDAAHIRADDLWNDHQSGIGAETGSPALDSVWEQAGRAAAATTTFNGHTYVLLAATDYNTAESQAVALGGHLVEINDAAENAFIDTLSEGSVWIGYNDQAVEGNFQWTTGTDETGYTNWNAGEPNDAGGEDAAEFVNGGGWNDLPISALRPAVVEIVPEPASLSLLALGAVRLLARRRRA